MLAKRIIPCLDVDDGRVVKGISFVELRDAGDPAELAAAYDREGADELVFLDITASSGSRETMISVVEKVSAKVFIPLTVGGGIRTVDDIRKILRAGADKVSVNTAAVLNPCLVKEGAGRFGNQCMVVAIDAKAVGSAGKAGVLNDLALDENSAWEVYTHGGRNSTNIDVVKWAIKVEELGAGEILLTSMDKDGHQQGYDIELIRTISEQVSIPVIASGGAGNLDHLYQAFEMGKADAVLAASIFHFGTYSIEKAKQFLSARGVVIRR